MAIGPNQDKSIDRDARFVVKCASGQAARWQICLVCACQAPSSGLFLAPPGKPGANAALKECRERLRPPASAPACTRRSSSNTRIRVLYIRVGALHPKAFFLLASSAFLAASSSLSLLVASMDFDSAPGLWRWSFSSAPR